MPAYRLMRRTMKDVLRNVRRAECIVLEANGSRAWMERLGFVEEARHRQRGKHGETYVTMAWINPEFADAADRG
jgi:RimJ/RimL family protein N-acetyltransferase